MHCIAESSFQFIGDYRKLDTLINHSTPVLGLTATATSKTLTEVQTVLKLNNPKSSCMATKHCHQNHTEEIKGKGIGRNTEIDN